MTSPVVSVTVTQLRTEDSSHLKEDWEHLVQYVNENQTDILVLPEIPFSHWFMENKPTNDTERTQEWEKSIKQHQHWIQKHFSSLPVKTIISSAPIALSRQHNEFFMWQNGKYTPLHHKYYLPEDEGTWEESWYDRGDEKSFEAFDIFPNIRGGPLLCSELWFMEHSRGYCKQNVDIVFLPRATGSHSLEKWTAGGISSAVISGAFMVSANRAGGKFGGKGWIISPDGVVLGHTTAEKPFLTLKIDTNVAKEAKSTYPRYVKD
jgi:N-carbamoylputrescine amidase